jgi:hypothetical protein
VTRALAFITLRVFELGLATFAPLFPSLAVAVAYLLDPLHERLAPRTQPIWPELREAHPPAPAGDWRENLP